jgi:hypothetical protein
VAIIRSPVIDLQAKMLKSTLGKKAIGEGKTQASAHNC